MLCTKCIKMKIFETFEGSKFVKFVMSIMKPQVNSYSIFHHSSVPLHINPLYVFSSCIFYDKKISSKSQFNTFKCSGENLPNSSCLFPNHQSFFLQIFYHSSLSCKLTLLYFFRSVVIYFAKRNQSK